MSPLGKQREETAVNSHALLHSRYAIMHLHHHTTRETRIRERGRTLPVTTATFFSPSLFPRQYTCKETGCCVSACGTGGVCIAVISVTRFAQGHDACPWRQPRKTRVYRHHGQ